MAEYRALIVDDEVDILELLEMTLSSMDVSCVCTEDVASAKQALAENSFDLCLTDMRLPDGDGIQLVEYMQTCHPDVPAAILTAYGNMRAAVNSLKAGAFDFVSKPVDLDILRNLVNTALQLKPQTGAQPAAGNLLGESSSMETLRSTVAKLARSQAPVLITGGSGTGKERVARAIHHQGPRQDHPFVPVNCGAIPDELMESEFFGHVKGSFTGATRDKDGLFQAAQGGTLFLDEVAELPLHMQVKLLRAIQERAIKAVGAEREVPVDARILSATHRDLKERVADGRFRQDLYYRLNVIEVKVPPLQERASDIPALSRDILAMLAERNALAQPPRLSDEAQAALQQYPFPGNVRELENILERALTLCEGATIETADLNLETQLQPAGTSNDGNGNGNNNPTAAPLEDHLENVEKRRIQKALEDTRYNKTAAAELLGISFRALRYRLKKLDME